MMILSDCHMHSRFSADSEADPYQMAESAKRKGFRMICFTDHQDKDYIVDGVEYVFETDKYMKELTDVREKYLGSLEICTGVEIGMQPHLGAYYQEYVNQYPFDFVIGSVHVVEGKDPYYDTFFDGRSDKEAYRSAMEETLKDIRTIRDFDALGHLDYVVRYGKEKENAYKPEEYMDIIDEILRFLIENGKGLELNTGGLKYGLPFAHPHPVILKRYRELGGEIITIGADAHRPEHTGYDFQKVPDILKSCGFRYYTEFRRRKPTFEKIP